jgi:hypothetical protein
MTIPKALRNNFLLYCILSVSHRLKIPEDEIGRWPLKRLVRWMAYFKIVREEEDKQLEEAKRRNRSGGRGNAPLKGFD